MFAPHYMGNPVAYKQKVGIVHGNINLFLVYHWCKSPLIVGDLNAFSVKVLSKVKLFLFFTFALCKLDLEYINCSVFFYISRVKKFSTWSLEKLVLIWGQQ